MSIYTCARLWNMVLPFFYWRNWNSICGRSGHSPVQCTIPERTEPNPQRTHLYDFASAHPHGRRGPSDPGQLPTWSVSVPVIRTQIHNLPTRQRSIQRKVSPRGPDGQFAWTRVSPHIPRATKNALLTACECCLVSVVLVGTCRVLQWHSPVPPESNYSPRLQQPPHHGGEPIETASRQCDWSDHRRRSCRCKPSVGNSMQLQDIGLMKWW